MDDIVSKFCTNVISHPFFSQVFLLFVFQDDIIRRSGKENVSRPHISHTIINIAFFHSFFRTLCTPWPTPRARPVASPWSSGGGTTSASSPRRSTPWRWKEKSACVEMDVRWFLGNWGIFETLKIVYVGGGTFIAWKAVNENRNLFWLESRFGWTWG